MQTLQLDYNHAATALEAFIAYDDTQQGPRPAVMVVHDWSGRNAFAEDKARMLAQMGYVGVAIDMYGKGVRGSNNEEKNALMTPLVTDRQLLRDRLFAARDALAQCEVIDHSQLAVMGFCFGGLCALEFARSGADLKGAVSVHGLLHRSDQSPTATIRSKVLALHGHDDPMATPDTVAAFTKEMTEAHADWQIHIYGNTLHAFTNPDANDPDFGTVYNPTAERRALASMQQFFAEIFTT